MRRRNTNGWFHDFLVLVVVIGTALAVSFLLARVNDDNNPFAMAVFMLAVALVARMTGGYCVVSVLISTLTTQIKQQEQLKLEAEKEKIHANLLRAVAHDIRTPLASILGASSALQEQSLPKEEQAELVGGIHRDAQWLVRVTENLLSVTRFSNHDVTLKKEDEVLEEIIGSAVVKYHRMPGSLPVLVDTPDTILVVPMDAMLMEQVLINLFDNVSVHAKGATRIWLHILPDQERVTLSVEDDGAGISPVRLQHVMDDTIRSGELLADNHRNMGIGLSVCRSIIQVHGGRLTAGKSAHGGAAFRFDLPRGGVR